MMMRGWVVFGVVIGQVFETGVPIDLEVVLFNLILDPKVAHGHGLGPFEFDSLVGITLVVLSLWMGVEPWG